MTKEMFIKCAPAGICFGASVGFYFWAAQLTRMINASLIVVLQPILFIVAAYFIFSETFTKTDAAFTVVAITGAVFLVLVGTNSGTSDIKGDLLVVVSVSIGATYFVFGRRTSPTVPVPEFMAGVFFWGGITLSSMISVGTINPLTSFSSEWLRIFSVAVVTLVGHILLNYAQGKAPFHMMGVLNLLMPVLSTFLAFWFLDQGVTALQFTGMAVVILALALHSVVRSSVSDSQN